MRTTIATLVLASMGATAFGQQQLELFSTGTPAGTGPFPASATNTTVSTVGPSTFRLNSGTSTNSTAFTTPTTTVSFAFSNQLYTSNGTPGIVAGATSANAVALQPGSSALFQPMNGVGVPSNDQYTSDPFGAVGTGFNVASNEGMRMFTDVTYLEGQSIGTPTARARYEFGTLTINFSRPVLNPVVHLAGIGGATYSDSATNGDPRNHLGFYTEFDLPAGSSYTLTRLAGSQYFTVSNTSITNTAPTPSVTPIDNTIYAYQSPGNYASGGSVRVNTGGTPINSVTFRVFVRSDGGVDATPGTTPPSWVAVNTPRAGDAFNISVSLPTYSLSGNVFNDANALTDATVNSTSSTAIPTGLSASLVDTATNTTVATVTVPASGASAGQYSFSNVLASRYIVVLSTPPNGWQNTGENLGAGPGNDGVINGRLSVRVGGTSTETNVTNANFGIRQTTPLALNLTRFDASATGCDVNINWEVSDNSHIATYDVQFSQTGKIQDFTTIAIAAGDKYMYRLRQTQPEGEGFYRLRVTENSGEISFSSVRSVRMSCDKAAGNISLYPNPTQGAVIVSGLATGEVLRLFDVNGRLMTAVTTTSSAATLDMTNMIPGVYQLRVTGSESAEKQNFTIIKQ